MVRSLDSILNKCPVCYNDLVLASTRIKACENEFCEYWFEEQKGISIIPEMRKRIDQVILDLSLVSECAFTGPTSFEPFPTFFLKNWELRTKWGYLDNIQNAKKKGTSDIKRTDDQNKDLGKIYELFSYIEPI